MEKILKWKPHEGSKKMSIIQVGFFSYILLYYFEMIIIIEKLTKLGKNILIYKSRNSHNSTEFKECHVKEIEKLYEMNRLS